MPQFPLKCIFFDLDGENGVFTLNTRRRGYPDMADQTPPKEISKLELDRPRVEITYAEAFATVSSILTGCGCDDDVAAEVANHLIDSNLSGVESHGIMRVLQYAQQFESGYMDPKGRAGITTIDAMFNAVDGGGGIGIPAMRLAFEKAFEETRQKGITCLPVRNVGHTGRHGAFAEAAAQQGVLTFLIGGGNRQTWRQVAPHGGSKAMLPTNPWCVGIPGGERGPVVLDFATSKIAGGWIYAAQSAGALLPEGCIIDRDGNPSRAPQDYFDGGAILPSGEHKGYALALMGELIGEAMLGPVSRECNWLLIAIDTSRFNAPAEMQRIAEDILAEMRDCPPAPGFDRVHIPGERESAYRQVANGVIALPEATWEQITALSRD